MDATVTFSWWEMIDWMTGRRHTIYSKESTRKRVWKFTGLTRYVNGRFEVEIERVGWLFNPKFFLSASSVDITHIEYQDCEDKQHGQD